MNPIQQAEKQFAEHFGYNHGVMLCNGTATLHCCLLALHVGAGDEVIVPALTMASPAIAVSLCGAKPVYADIDSETFNMDPSDMARKITPKTRAIIAVSLYGLAPDMAGIMAFAHHAGLPVIEDNAQCLTPACRGDMLSFSFQATKHISCGEGGMVLTHSDHYAERVREFGNLGYKSPIDKESLADPKALRHFALGHNYRPSYLQAERLLEQLPQINRIVQDRVELARMYAWAFDGYDRLRPQKVPVGFNHSYWTYATVLERGDWREFVDGIQPYAGGRIYGAWGLAYREPALLDEEVSCPVAEKLQARMVQFNSKHDIPYGGLRLRKAVVAI